MPQKCKLLTLLLFFSFLVLYQLLVINFFNTVPITQSAKKELRQNLRRRQKNLIYKNKIKGLIKEIKLLVSQKKTEEAKKLLPQIYKTLDKAAKKGVIKKNTAANKKSRLTKLINKNLN